MINDFLYVSEIIENGFCGYSEDYPTICYNIGRVKDEEFLDRLLEISEHDKTIVQPFAAGKYVSVLTYNGDNNKWRIEFWDFANDEKKAIDCAVKYDFEMARKLMSVFNTVSHTYEREHGKFQMVVGQVRPASS